MKQTGIAFIMASSNSAQFPIKGGFLYLYNVLFQVLLDKSDGISIRIESLKKNS